MRKFIFAFCLFFLCGIARADQTSITTGSWLDLRGDINSNFTELYGKWTSLGSAYDTSTELEALFGAKEGTLTNEAGLYSALSDVSDFVQPSELVGADETYGSGWDGDVGLLEKDDIYDYLHQFDTDDDGDFTDESWFPSGGSLADDSLLEVKLDATNSPTDDYILSYDSATGGFTWVVDATGAGGDQLVDIVATSPLLVNGGANIDNALPGSDSDVTFSMPAATTSVPGYMTAAQATALAAIDTEAELEALLELQDLQGAVTDSQVPNDITITGLSGTNSGDNAANTTYTIGSATQAYDTDLDDLADGSLTGSKVGSGISGTNITTGTVADDRIASTIARDSEVSALQADDLVTLSGVAIGSTHLGTFTGDTITDNSTIKTALQELETEIEDTVTIDTNGILVRTGAGTAAARTLTEGTGIDITNGDGVSGNPTIAVDADATEISFTPNGSIEATTVQAAIQEVRDEAGGSSLTEEQVEDYVGGMLGGTETRITVTYDDTGNAINFVVDDMNDDVPEAGDFGAATDLDSNGALNSNSVAYSETTGSSKALTPVVDAAADFAANFTGANLYGGTFICDTAGTIQLPAVTAGMNFVIITKGAIAVVVEPNANDMMMLDGVDLDDADSATNTSTAGDIIVFQYMSSAGWVATSNGWTDED